MRTSPRPCTRLFLVAATMIAVALAEPLADTNAGLPNEDAGSQTWRAQLIDGTMRGTCSQYLRHCQSGAGHCLVPDITVVYHNDEFGAYPPVLFWGKTLLGGASVSTAGCVENARVLCGRSCSLTTNRYANGWTWAGSRVWFVTNFTFQVVRVCSC